MSGITYEQFVADIRIYYSVMKNVEVIGEAANMLTRHFRETHTELPWRLIVSMRNVLVHGYAQVSDADLEAPIYLWQEDHTFTLPVFDDMIVLLLIDNNDVEVYWAMIPVGTTIVNLPSSYTGNYELRLVLTDNSYYVGDITL